MGQFGQNGPNQFKMVQNGPKWTVFVLNGHEQYQAVTVGLKWAKGSFQTYIYGL